jgi:hypothetical protein
LIRPDSPARVPIMAAEGEIVLFEDDRRVLRAGFGQQGGAAVDAGSAGTGPVHLVGQPAGWSA